jgi:alpha-galactosidase
MIQTWVLGDGGQSFVLASFHDRLPQVVYWGPAIDDDADAIAAAIALDVGGGMLDAIPDLSICPEASQGFAGQPGLMIAKADGTPFDPRFTLAGVQADHDHVAFTYTDADHGLTYEAFFTFDPETRMITARAAIEAETPVRVQYLAAPVLPAPQLADEMIDYAGGWINEFQPNRVPWTAGIRMRDNRTGRTGHEHYPAVLLPERGATHTQGNAYAIHYGWSGGHRMVAEELPDGRRQVQFGHAMGTQLAAGTRFETGPLYAVFSDTGLNGCAVAFQRHLRDRIIKWPDANRPRPVHYNCWEAIYFDHDMETLKSIADSAAKLGAERFVLDDGWFGKRDDDTTSLGDWDVDPRKYPDGLGPLVDHIHGLGMRFGIWFEPEMVNPDSDLYRAHPDWALGRADQTLGRYQMVLDMSKAEVRDYLFEKIAAVLTDIDVDYIKWDHNRVLPVADAAQAQGYYALLERLRGAFPDTEIESCSSGGGRMDFGALSYTHRVWLSDCIDPVERLRQQAEAAQFLPLVVTGSHVGAHESHTTGRQIDIHMRAWVASQRHMGFEMDPRFISDEDAAVLTRVTTWWKENRHWREKADILRLDTADAAVIAEQQVAIDGTRFIVYAGHLEASKQNLPRPLRLTGLDPSAMYRVSLLNIDERPPQSRGDIPLAKGPIEVSGQFLMHHGLSLPWSFPQTMWVIEGERI